MTGDPDEEMRRAVASELFSGERLLWVGRPDPSLLFASGDLVMIPFSILWSGMAIVMGVLIVTKVPTSTSQPSAATMPPAIAVAIGVLAVLAGLYLLVGRFVAKARRKRRTTCALTDRRAILVRDGVRHRVATMPLLGPGSWSANLHGDGSGDVVFGSPPWRSRNYTNVGLDFLVSGMGRTWLGFFDLPDAATVVALLEGRR